MHSVPHSPQVPHLLLPAGLQRLAAAGPRRALLRLAGGQHPAGGVPVGRAQRRHLAARGGGALPLPALLRVAAGE